ncbi:MAG: uroporphyrinogen-III synthase [Bacteroidales bacterium]|nr:uroporphyrinogen-III synthase [Bacteroidales bacterium]
MKIKNILVSQPTPQNEKSPYFDLEKKYGVKVDFRSFIEVKGYDVREFRKQKVNILEHSAVIMTSKTAIDNYFRIAEEMRLTIPISMKFFCVTESIAYYLQKYITYRKRKIFYSQKMFDELLELMTKHRKEKFLLPVAKTHKPTISKKLKAANFSFSKAVMYETVSADLSDLTDIHYDVIVFFSPVGITSLLENFPNFEQNGRIIASLGKSTANAVKKAGLRLDINAPTKEYPSMTMAIEKFIIENNK